MKISQIYLSKYKNESEKFIWRLSNILLPQIRPLAISFVIQTKSAKTPYNQDENIYAKIYHITFFAVFRGPFAPRPQKNLALASHIFLLFIKYDFFWFFSFHIYILLNINILDYNYIRYTRDLNIIIFEILYILDHLCTNNLNNYCNRYMSYPNIFPSRSIEADLNIFNAEIFILRTSK